MPGEKSRSITLKVPSNHPGDSNPAVHPWMISIGSFTCKCTCALDRTGGVLCVWRWSGMLMFSLSHSNKLNSCRHVSPPYITTTISCSGDWPRYFLPRKLLSAICLFIVRCCSHCCTSLVSAGEWVPIISWWSCPKEFVAWKECLLLASACCS